jgi:adenylate kinase
MRIVLLGPPGAGKGTQAHHLADRYDHPLISTGDIFRGNVENETELGAKAKEYMDKGELVPDLIVVEMVLERLSDPDCYNGFILDGFPRTLHQAEALDRALARQGKPLNAVLYFRIPDEIAVKRLVGRRTCRRCQRSYNVEFHPPKVEDVCDRCGGQLVQRRDDEESTVRHRIEIYHRDTEKLADQYRERSILREVNADGYEEWITERAIAALGDVVPAVSR